VRVAMDRMLLTSPQLLHLKALTHTTDNPRHLYYMHIASNVFEIKTEIYWGGGRREREHTREKYLRNTTSQHYHSWRNGGPTGELLSSLVYLLSKWHCQRVQLCVVYVGTQHPGSRSLAFFF
jgi:hypothetical protein